jgi:hypothetical protein
MRFHQPKNGFALILVLGVLLIAASIAATVISRQENKVVWNPILNTQDQLDTVQQALVAYQRKNHYLPLPAPRAPEKNGVVAHVQMTGDLNILHTIPTSVQTEFDSGATSVAVADSGLSYVKNATGDVVVIGAIPTETLGLPRAAAEDAEGKFLTYAVTFTATDFSTYDSATGAIDVTDAKGSTIASEQMFLVLSHGADAKGGWSAKSRFKARECAGGINNKAGGGPQIVSIDAGNCDENDASFVANDLTLAAGGKHFDDQLLRGLRDKKALDQNKPCPAQNITWGAGLCAGAIPPPGLADNSTNGSPTQITVTTTTAATGDITLECDNGNIVIINETCTLPASSCALPWGGTINDGDSVNAYAVASVTCGNSCPAPILRTCSNGVLSGSGDFASCSVDACASCPLPWGGTIAHGQSVTAYDAVVCPANNGGKPVVCNNETRTCNNGTLSGSYTNQNSCLDHCVGVNGCNGASFNWTVGGESCAASVAAAADGVTLIATDNTAPATGARNFLCSNGSWVAQGGATCSAAAAGCGTTTLNWTVGGDSCSGTIAAGSDGQVNAANDSTAPTTGISNFSCSNGSWVAQGGATCTTAAVGCGAVSGVNWSVSGVSCTGNLASASDGQTGTVSDNTAPSTGSRNYICNNGTWSAQGGGSCAASNASCALPWGGTLAHGTSVNAYSAASVTCGNSCPAPVSRTCNNGVLSGSGDFASCSVDSCASCNLPWGGTILDGQTANAYAVSSVSCGNSCPASAVRTCSNGVLSGSGNFSSCSVDACSACATQTKNWTILGVGCSAPAVAGAHGTSRTVSDSTHPGTGSRNYQCDDGTWIAQNTGTCAGSPCALPWGGTLAHGNSVTAYAETCGSGCVCVPQTRTCTNGVLSGSATNQNCTSLPGSGGNLFLPDPGCPANEVCESYLQFGVCKFRCNQ